MPNTDVKQKEGSTSPLFKIVFFLFLFFLAKDRQPLFNVLLFCPNKTQISASVLEQTGCRSGIPSTETEECECMECSKCWKVFFSTYYKI